MPSDFHFNHETDQPVLVKITKDRVSVTLADGRIISNPLEWHGWLKNAAQKQQANYELLPFSIYWPDLDEGLDIEGMLRGIRPALDADKAAALQSS